MSHRVPTPTEIHLHRAEKRLDVAFDDGARFSLPAEYLRVESPSAEVQGHGPGQEVLQTGKLDVGIVDLQTVGHYAVQPSFSDGHDTGIFSWDYLYHLGADQEALWAQYGQRIEAAGTHRDAPMTAAAGGAGGACGHHH